MVFQVMSVADSQSMAPRAFFRIGQYMVLIQPLPTQCVGSSRLAEFTSLGRKTVCFVVVIGLDAIDSTNTAARIAFNLYHTVLL